MKSKISIILPTYNEAENIVPLIDEIRKNLAGFAYEIIVVDDNSPDGTGQIAGKKFAKNRNIKIYSRKESGLASAVFYGLKRAGGDFIAVMDTDFNHDPKVLPEMAKVLSSFDLCVGSRYVQGGGMENRLRNILSLLYNRVVKFLLHLPTNDNLSGFFMIKQTALKKIMDKKIFYGYGDYFIRFLFLAKQKELRICEIPVYYRNRIHGVSKSQFINMFVDYSKTVGKLLNESN